MLGDELREALLARDVHPRRSSGDRFERVWLHARAPAAGNGERRTPGPSGLERVVSIRRSPESELLLRTRLGRGRTAAFEVSAVLARLELLPLLRSEQRAHLDERAQLGLARLGL